MASRLAASRGIVNGRDLADRVYVLTPLVRLCAHPADATIDVPLSVRVSEATAGDTVEVAATMRTWNGRAWRSRAAFRARDDGSVDLARDAPIDGAWTTPDPCALLWSMVRAAGDDADAHRVSVLEPRELTITATTSEGATARCSAIRRLAAPGVTRALVREAGLSGAVYAPAGDGPRPAVLVLGGSSGEPDYAHAALLASHGFVALALAYFRADDQPTWLHRVPIETLVRAARWVRARAGGNFVGAWGTSRGAEAALLVASASSDVGAVVSVAGSGLRHGALAPPEDTRARGGAAWTRRGRPLAYVDEHNRRADPTLLEGSGALDETRYHRSLLRDARAVRRATIPVERIAGPVLLIAGDDDRCWPAAELSEIAMSRLRKAQRPHADRLVVYSGAGHFLGAPHLPCTTDRYTHALTRATYLAGGNPEADARACAAFWPIALGHLRAAAGVGDVEV